jgi:hypothetical protein
MKKQTVQSVRYPFFPKGVSTITVVVLGVSVDGKKVQPVQRFSLAKSEVDMSRFPRRSDGEPIFGPRVYRERSKKELKAAGFEGAEYLATLVPLCNTGQPWLVPEAVTAA